jgi:DNA replication protein DnaC
MIKLTIPDAPDHDTGREREYHLNANLRDASISLAKMPSRFADARITNSDVGAWAQNLVDITVTEPRPVPNPRVVHGPSLLITGPTGTGKTFESYGAVNQLAGIGLLRKWVITTAPDLYGSLRPRANFDSESRIQEILRTPLLVVDDLGAAKTSEWVEEITYRVVNTRYEQQRPTIYTSNLTGPQLREVVGERIASRLTECRQVALTGPDRRRKAS